MAKLTKRRKVALKKIDSENKAKKKKKIKKNVNKTKKKNKFCFIAEKCDIDEISEYLIKIGKEKDYPNIAKY